MVDLEARGEAGRAHNQAVTEGFLASGLSPRPRRALLFDRRRPEIAGGLRHGVLDGGEPPHRSGPNGRKDPPAYIKELISDCPEAEACIPIQLRQALRYQE